MNRLLDEGLEQLTVLLYNMGEAAEKVLDISLNGFVNGKDTMDQVHDISEMLAAMSVDTENKAFELIVKYQPVASDLRIINSYMKIAYDFERYGRYAWDISLTHKKFATLAKCPKSDKSILELIQKVAAMVSKSVQALKLHDAELAKTLASTEEEVDALFFEYLNKLANAKVKTKCMMCNLLVARYLERIADHTSYVAESIIYIVTGKKMSVR
jgi:phosphate transport system protein